MKPLLVALFLLLPVLAEAQNVRNPGTASYTSSDYNLVERHELRVVRESDQQVVQMYVASGPFAAADIVTTFNVRPIPFGTYHMEARACSGTLCSDWSAPSNLFDRAPGRPSAPVLSP